MKQLLIIRVPKDATPAKMDEHRTLYTSYDIIAIKDDVERVEFEIVYNPHFKLQLEGFDLEAIRKQAIRFALQGLIEPENIDAAITRIYDDLMQYT